MRRVWAGIGQAVESAAIAAVGVVVCALALLAVWGIDQGFAGDPLLQWRIAVDAWMLGHGVDVGITLAPDAVRALGLEDGGRSFVLTLGAWGIGLLTLWLHWRSGRRLAELPLAEAGVAVVAGALATGAVGLLAGASAQHATAAPNLGQAFAFPAIVALVGMAGALLAARGHDWLHALARALTIEDGWLRPVRAALRTGLGGAVGALGVGALLVGVGVLLRFTDGLLLMESLEVTHVGAGVLLLLQLALAPVAIVWGAAWAIGPGFMVGRGSSVSPLDTELGPVPSLPLLTAIDPDVQPWMLVVVALPVLAAVMVGAFARQTVLAGSTDRPVHWWELGVSAVGGGALAGALLGVAAMLSTGAVGPGRLSDTGPDAVLVAAWGALEVGAGLIIGMLAGGRGASALASEGAGSSMRAVLGFGRGDDEPAREDAAAAADAPSTGSDAQETEVVAALPAHGSRPSEAPAVDDALDPPQREGEVPHAAAEPRQPGAEPSRAEDPPSDAEDERRSDSPDRDPSGP